MNNDCVVIVSGGMDSVTLLHHLVAEGKHPAVITFLYGQKLSCEVEFARLNAAKLSAEPHLIADLNTLAPIFNASALVSAELDIPTIEAVQGNQQPITYVPNRNMIFLSLAVAFAETLGVCEVYYGAQRHDLYAYWDTTPAFLGAMNEVLGLNRGEAVRVYAPFVDDSKADILRRGLALGVDYAQTWSCYRGGEAACGTCPTCAERLKAFAELGIEDPLPYFSK